MASRPLLYSMDISHYCIAADRMLAFKGVEFETRPVLHDDQERWVFEEMQTRARGPWHVLEMRREEFRQDMNKHLGMVDAILDGRDWILGQPSLADFGIYGSISPLLTVGEMIPAEFPRLGRWASRIGKLGR